MKVTAQEEYGLRCLLRLARQGSCGAPVTVRRIASQEGLSAAYTEKLLRLLSRARLAESIRGSRGGYRIRRPPEQVTLGEVIRALGGVPDPNNLCRRYTGNEDHCVHQADCGLRPIWKILGLYMERILDGVPLSALLEPEAVVTAALQKMESNSTRPNGLEP
jgi:Rrf2 family iron-sulfur cluster assembly transcriptional regulator